MPRRFLVGHPVGEDQVALGETIATRRGAVDVEPRERADIARDHVLLVQAHPVLGIAGTIAECNDNLLLFNVVSIIGADFLRERSRVLYSQNAGHEEPLGLQYFLHHLVG